MSDTVDVSAIVVNWNTADLLADCLTALRANAPAAASMEIVVVDNGSDDGSAAMVYERFPDVHLLANARNEGYQRANNRAIRKAAGAQLLLVNADAMVGPGAVDALLERMKSDPRAAVVGPRLVYGDGRFQRWTAGRAPDPLAVATFYLGLERLSAASARRSLFLFHDVDEPFCPDWVSSACMLVRREALDEIGLLDERYLCYMDDVDLCARARFAGWRVWYEPAAHVVHLMGQSSKRNRGNTSPAAIRNFNDYVRRRHGPASSIAARACEVTGFSARAVAHLVRGLASRGSGYDDARAHARNVLVSLRRGHV